MFHFFDDRGGVSKGTACVVPWLTLRVMPLGGAPKVLDPEDDPEEEEEDGGTQDIDANRNAKSAVMKTSTRQVTAVLQGHEHLMRNANQIQI